jgi:hypothetical protein
MDYEALAKKFGGVVLDQPQQQPNQIPWAAGMPQSKQDDVRIKMNQEGRKRLADLQLDIANAQSTLNDLEEFGRLNRQTATGSLWQQFTPDKQAFRSDDSMNMSSITNRLAPAQRQPGSGSTSDLDVRMFLKALPSVENNGDVNKAIRLGFEQQYKRAVEKANAMRNHLDQYGHLMDFDSQWAKSRMESSKAEASKGQAPQGQAGGVKFLGFEGGR